MTFRLVSLVALSAGASLRPRGLEETASVSVGVDASRTQNLTNTASIDSVQTIEEDGKRVRQATVRDSEGHTKTERLTSLSKTRIKELKDSLTTTQTDKDKISLKKTKVCGVDNSTGKLEPVTCEQLKEKISETETVEQEEKLLRDVEVFEDQVRSITEEDWTEKSLTEIDEWDLKKEMTLDFDSSNQTFESIGSTFGMDVEVETDGDAGGLLGDTMENLWGSDNWSENWNF